MADSPQLVVACYRPRPGREEELLERVREHQPLLRREGLVTGRAPVVMQAADGTIVEIFEWRSAAAIERAHLNEAVQALWAGFETAAEHVTLGSLAEAGRLFAGFRPLDPGSGSAAAGIGTIGWTDLTVPDAERLRDFYGAVVGWVADEVPMGGYSDYAMRPPGPAAAAEAVAGICHARGANAELPPAWLPYVRVADLGRSLEECGRRGGSVVAGARPMGPWGRFAVIRDPAGAVLALIEPPAPR